MVGKKIMITGGSGFLGSHVVDQFNKKGYSKLIIPRSHQYDLRNQSACFSLVNDTKPDIIVHLAASVGGIDVIGKALINFMHANWNRMAIVRDGF